MRRRGALTLWLDEAALTGWAAPKRSSPGGQPLYSDMAIELVLTLRLVFRLALRQAEAFSRSVLGLLGLAPPVPDHGTLSRRGWAFAGRQPRVQASTAAAATRQRHPPLDVVVPPRASAAPSSDGSSGASQNPRDRHIQLVEPRGSPGMAERGRMGWQQATGYGRRNQAETAVALYKHLIGPKLRARSLPVQRGEVAIAVAAPNQMIRTAKPVSVRVA